MSCGCGSYNSASLEMNRDYDPYPELLNPKNCYGSNPRSSGSVGSKETNSKENYDYSEPCGQYRQASQVGGYASGATNPVYNNAVFNMVKIEKYQAPSSMQPYELASKAWGKQNNYMC